MDRPLNKVSGSYSSSALEGLQYCQAHTLKQWFQSEHSQEGINDEMSQLKVLE